MYNKTSLRKTHELKIEITKNGHQCLNIKNKIKEYQSKGLPVDELKNELSNLRKKHEQLTNERAIIKAKGHCNVIKDENELHAAMVDIMKENLTKQAFNSLKRQAERKLRDLFIGAAS